MRNYYQTPNHKAGFAKIACWEGGPLTHELLIFLIAATDPTFSEPFGPGCGPQ